MKYFVFSDLLQFYFFRFIHLKTGEPPSPLQCDSSFRRFKILKPKIRQLDNLLDIRSEIHSEMTSVRL